MVEGTDERRMSSKFLVRKFPGAIISDKYHYLTPLLKKNPDYVILYVSIHDVVNYEGKEIVDKLLQLK